MAVMFGFLGTPTFDFILTLRVLNMVVLVLMNSGFHHLQAPIKLKVSNTLVLQFKKVLTVVKIVIYATVMFLS